MPPTQLPLLAAPHQNHYLFSDYYLRERVQARKEWQTTTEEVAALMATLQALRATVQPEGKGLNESQTEADWIRPVLDALGHHYTVQVALRTPHGTKRPDYLLYPDGATRQAALALGTLSEQETGGAVAVADAKAWARPLDQAVGKREAREISAIPSVQIDFYLRHTRLPWGILTNGRQWRLYHQATSRKLDVFYQVDLLDLLDLGDVEAFKYFALFFRRAAFTGDWLQTVLEESRTYEQGVSDDLQGQVYEALRELAAGFLAFPPNGLAPTPDVLGQVYQASLIILYRLLFILYAESRHLLPLQDSPLYRDSYSLEALKQRVARELDAGRIAGASVATLWPALVSLWRIVNEGNPELGVPAYDGGLFRPSRYPFLEAYQVGDLHLRRALDLLARALDPATGRREFVDYRDLEIRHLGSIYEGLLEYHLVAEGETVALETDKGERKATGSYYTPDYIVQYMVEATLEPLIEALEAAHAGDPAALAEAILDLNVVDPAAGSGHFLVGATDYLARRLVELEADGGALGPGEGAVAYWRRRVVQSCIYGVDLNPLAVELAKLSLWLATVARDKPLNFLDHHLRPGNSLVGAWLRDLHPTPPKAKASRKEQKKIAAGQITMLDDPAFAGALTSATGSMARIEALGSDTVADVHEAEALYQQEVRAATRHHRQLANVQAARTFGLVVDETTWKGLVSHVLHGAFAMPRFTEVLAEAGTMKATFGFFHWELEFPEVFLGARRGFDAVLGNPPYVRQERLVPLKPFLEGHFASYHSVGDLYLYFFEQGVRLLGEAGRLGYISSGTFARANFARAFRQYLPTVAQVEQVVDFGENQPFEGAEMVRPSIVILRRGEHEEDFGALFIEERVPDDLAAAFEREGFTCAAESIQRPEWLFQPASQTRLFEKIMEAEYNLEEYLAGAEVQMYRGVLTGLNEAFLIDQVTRDALVQADPTSADVLKPMLRGSDLRPWYQQDEGRWLIFTRRGMDIDKYPAIKDHLEQYHKQLEPRPTDWPRGRRWPGRKTGNYAWYEIQDTVDYHECFEQPKILWPDISKLPRFSWDDEGKYVNNTGYIIPLADPYLLGILQSRPLWFAISQICQPLRLRAGLWQYRVINQFVSRLPIPAASSEERTAIGELAMAATEEARARYALHQRVVHRMVTDLAEPGATPNRKLSAWWELEFGAFRREVGRALGRDIPLKARDEWEAWLGEAQVRHQAHTAALAAHEAEIDARVYALFGLSEREVGVIVEQTKYRYGGV